MLKQLHFFIIEDAPALEQYSSILKSAGHLVTTLSSHIGALEKILSLKPDCLIANNLLIQHEGRELIKEIKQAMLDNTPVIVMSDETYHEQDAIGIDAYIQKPIQPEMLLNELLDIIAGTMRIQVWGCRGTLPVPGGKSTRYGGNTNCITLRIANRHFFIFDAGTGIRELSTYLVKAKKVPLNAKIFITHPHYDHIHGMPFFSPLYMKGNNFEILGPNNGDNTIEKLIAGQMNAVYFPVTIAEFSAKIKFRDLTEEEFYLDDVLVKTIALNHPGRCLGYRIEYKNKSFCYITDNELYYEDSPRYNPAEVEKLIQFIKETNVVIMDTTYSDEEYPSKVGWGHSCVSRVVDVAMKANVKLLCLHHHDPGQIDRDIDAKLQVAKSILASHKSNVRCIAPHEGDEIEI